MSTEIHRWPGGRTARPELVRRAITAGLSCGAFAAACGSPAESSWERRVGVLPVALSAIQAVAAPTQVEAGVPFTVTITTVGSSSCTRGDGVELERTPARLQLTPYDWVAVRATTCTRDVAPFPRTVELMLATPGTYALRVTGAALPGDDSGGVIDVPIVVVAGQR